MVRNFTVGNAGGDGSPHVRGDGPRCFTTGDLPRLFSPRAWGWSENDRFPGFWDIVLPTCVGMVRIDASLHARGERSPHVRGDGPKRNSTRRLNGLFSPRAWGWSADNLELRRLIEVLPTCVGMVRVSVLSCAFLLSSPHVRGDGKTKTDLYS